jgi:hypothetical protein
MAFTRSPSAGENWRAAICASSWRGPSLKSGTWITGSGFSLPCRPEPYPEQREPWLGTCAREAQRAVECDHDREKHLENRRESTGRLHCLRKLRDSKAWHPEAFLDGPFSGPGVRADSPRVSFPLRKEASAADAHKLLHELRRGSLQSGVMHWIGSRERCTTFKQTGKNQSDFKELGLSKIRFSHSFPHIL